MKKKFYNHFYAITRVIIAITLLHLSSCSDEPINATLLPTDGSIENSLKVQITATFSKDIVVPNDWGLKFTVTVTNSTTNICTSYIWDKKALTVTCLHDELLNGTSYTSQISNIEDVTNVSATFTTLSGDGIGWAAGSMSDGYGTIIFTNNSGETWTRQGNSTQIPNITITDVGVYNSLTAWAIGESDGNLVILKTSDSGSTWTRQGTTLGLSSSLFGVSVLNSKTVWVVGSDSTILFTNDGGQNWTLMNNGVPNGINFGAITAIDANHVWAVAEINVNNSIIFHTDNGGITWTQQGPPVGAPSDFSPIDISSSSPTKALCVGIHDSIITSDGGTNWSESFPYPVHINGAYALDENKLWMAVDYGVIYYTIDGGDTWTQAESVPGSAGGLAMMGIFFQGNGTKGWAVGSILSSPPKMGILLTSSDGGKNWTEQTSPVNVMYRRVAFVGKQK